MNSAEQKRRFLFLLASTRPDGNSERLARRAASFVPRGAEVRWLRLDEHPLPPFRDVRHGGAFTVPEGEAATLVQATLEATDLVVVTPVYWYSLPAAAKAYFDHWSAWLRIPELGFGEAMKGRTLWVIAVDSSEPSDGAADPLVAMLQKTADYMEMRWAGALLGHANRPGEIEGDGAAWAAAVTFFSREVTR